MTHRKDGRSRSRRLAGHAGNARQRGGGMCIPTWMHWDFAASGTDCPCPLPGGEQCRDRGRWHPAAAFPPPLPFPHHCHPPGRGEEVRSSLRAHTAPLKAAAQPPGAAGQPDLPKRAGLVAEGSAPRLPSVPPPPQRAAFGLDGWSRSAKVLPRRANDGRLLVYLLSGSLQIFERTQDTRQGQ